MMYLKAYLGTAVSFLVIDAIWIVTVVKPYYSKEVGSLLRDSPNMLASGAFYLLYAAGIVMLAVSPALSVGSVRTALLNGAVLGAMAYGTYTVTNYAVLEGWTRGLVVSDVLWGCFLTAVTAAAGFYAGRL